MIALDDAYVFSVVLELVGVKLSVRFDVDIKVEKVESDVNIVLTELA